MTVIKINAIEMPADSGDLLAERFAPRAHAMDSVPGFQSFELLRPEDDRTTWLVVTRWDNQEAYDAWLASEDFAAKHAHTDKKPASTASNIWNYSVAVTSA